MLHPAPRAVALRSPHVAIQHGAGALDRQRRKRLLLVGAGRPRGRRTAPADERRQRFFEVLCRRREHPLAPLLPGPRRVILLVDRQRQRDPRELFAVCAGFERAVGRRERLRPGRRSGDEVAAQRGVERVPGPVERDGALDRIDPGRTGVLKRASDQRDAFGVAPIAAIEQVQQTGGGEFARQRRLHVFAQHAAQRLVIIAPRAENAPFGPLRLRLAQAAFMPQSIDVAGREQQARPRGARACRARERRRQEREP